MHQKPIFPYNSITEYLRGIAAPLNTAFYLHLLLTGP